MTDRIIIADDHPIFRDGMRRLVQKAVPGAIVCDVGTAEDLNRLVATGEPAVLLVLDLVFPGFNGPDSIAAMRQACPTTPLVGTTSRALNTDPQAKATGGVPEKYK